MRKEVVSKAEPGKQVKNMVPRTTGAGDSSFSATELLCARVRRALGQVPPSSVGNIIPGGI